MPNHLPKLRPLDIRPINHRGDPYLLLRDPQQIAEQQLLVPQPLAAVLAFCDGQHDVAGIVDACHRRYELRLPHTAVADLVTALDAAVMLENERAAQARARALQSFRAAPYRRSALAGVSYPGESKLLWPLLQDYLEQADGVTPVQVDWSRPVGLLSPHIDYPRGGAVYAQVWQRAAQLAQEAELVIMLGTDHYGSDLFTLTRQNYATPYGVLPTDTAVVDRLAAMLGPDIGFAGELRHRGEHSLELVAVWLHHLRAGNPVPVVPILVGSFHPFIEQKMAPEEHPLVDCMLQTLRELAQGRRTLVVASGDLAHVGPAFGGRALDAAGRERLRTADEELVAAMRAGDADAFFTAIRAVRDRNNVCGVAPIYLTMRLLGGLAGEQWGYAVCPADEQNTSVVTVTGMVFA